MIIAIDGTASSGKSSIARALGKKLGFSVLGTGSIYRAIALKLLNLGIKADDDESIKQILETTTIESVYNGETTYIVLDGIIQPAASLNSHEVSVFVPHIASKEYVRVFVRKIQHDVANKNENIIVEGRDIGSVVFPEADIKLFIDADAVTRAKRRQANYLEQGKATSIEDVLAEIEERDNEDRTREVSPLIMTSDSMLIDTSSCSIDESVNMILKMVSDKRLNSI